MLTPVLNESVVTRREAHYTRGMASLPSTHVLYRVTTGCYALGLFFTYLVGVSGHAYYIHQADPRPLILIPIGLTALLLMAQVLIVMRAQRAGVRSAPSPTWIVLLILYTGVTWFAYQIANLRLL